MAPTLSTRKADDTPTVSSSALVENAKVRKGIYNHKLPAKLKLHSDRKSNSEKLINMGLEI